MRCLTSSEIHKWLAGQGMHHQPLDCGVPVAGEFPIPMERRARIQLADHLADLLAKDGNKLIEALPMPQARTASWESLERFRHSHEEMRTLTASPGHLFKSRDRHDFRMMLAMLLGSADRCSFYVYSAPSHTTLRFGDQIEIWSRKSGLRNELGRYLSAALAA